MLFEDQFSSVGELARRKKEEVCPAAKGPSDERQRALRGFAIGGDGSGQQILGVVTSFPNQEVAASRMKLRPPTPNQTPEPTALLVTFRAFARPAPSSAVAHL